MTRVIPPIELIYSVLAGPVIWFVHFAAVYALAEFGCRANFTNLVFVTPDAIRATTVVLTVIALAAVAVGGFLAYRNWTALRDAPNGGDSTVEARRQFLSMIGAALSGLFLLSIVATAVSMLFLSVCDRVA